MPLSLILQIIPTLLPYGIQAVQQFVKIFSSPTAPTAADWTSLQQLTQTTARQQMLSVLQQHGIDPTSPAGQAFINLTPA